MAPKTYPQQIADLKAEKQELLDEIETLKGQLELLPELTQKVSDLEGQLLSVSNQDNQSHSALQAKLNDANQRADSEAAHARRVVDENTRLAHVNGQLHNGLEKLEHIAETVAKKDQELANARAFLDETTARFRNRENQYRDAIVEKEAALEAQSRELQGLRLNARTQDRILSEVRAALATAPDLLSALKYIVGINGPGTE